MRFAVNKIAEKYVLADSFTGCTADVVPAWGGILNAFSIMHHGKACNVISGYDNDDDFRLHVTSKGFRGSKLLPFVCRINKAQYNWQGKLHTLSKFLLNGSALHGLVYDAAFDVAAVHAGDEGAMVALKYKYDKMNEGYPFPFSCSVEYSLLPDNKISITTTVHNNSDIAIPVTDGWHPYFGFGGTINSFLLQIKSGKMAEYNKDLIPTGNYLPETSFNTPGLIGDKHLDDCFVLDFTQEQPLCSLLDKPKGLQLNIYPDKTYPYLQVYTPADRQSIAIENLSGLPDAFNNGIGLTVLLPGEEKNYITCFEAVSVAPLT
ncbi:MAG: aldose 1-epimerase [Chitinophagaceae bacterium]|nr:aldose 1-epimerase [Chitinophagaceae bacterium]